MNEITITWWMGLMMASAAIMFAIVGTAAKVWSYTRRRFFVSEFSRRKSASGVARLSFVCCGDVTMKILTLICALIGVSQTYGNVVEWGCFSLIDVSGYPTLGYAGTTLHTDTSISLKLTQSGGNLTIAESGYTSLVSFSAWTLAYASEIVASEMFEDESRVYLWKGCQTGESFDVNASSDAFYLSFMTQLWKDDEFTVKDKITYGWVCVGVQNGVLTLLDSAIALDGSRLYVGGSVIPEPSSAVLLLFGCAGLLLKRRQRKFGGTP